ncbi:YbhB/YbcL family Raf kinase inhibitor-like protein [Mycobacterium avium]|uniref:YbhB/YbcL family Raf kinase inhibitor-like protein n=1 Tax=Mycobacterium avium TaxID=1764 RepID=UPI0009B7F772
MQPWSSTTRRPAGPYVHWVVTGIAPAPAARPRANAARHNDFAEHRRTGRLPGPCPPAGTGTHHYRFTLYQLPNDYQLPPAWRGCRRRRRSAPPRPRRLSSPGCSAADRARHDASSRT